MDFNTVTAGVAAVKSGLDTIKAAVSIVKDVRDALPNGSEKEQISASLADAAGKITEGEAAVAAALGYTLCRCEFPPTPMLMVGHLPMRHLNGIDKGQVLSQKPRVGGSMTGSIPVHECPKCKTTDAPSYPNFQRVIST